MGHGGRGKPGARGWGALGASGRGARGTPGVLRGRARPHPGSRVPSARREGSNIAGKDPRAQRQGQGAHAGCCEPDGGELRTRLFRRPKTH